MAFEGVTLNGAEAAPMELLTSSRMRCFRECSRLHEFKYVQLWRPAKTADALRFGSLIHRGLEAYWSAIAAWQKDSTVIESDFLVPAMAALEVETDPFDRVRAEEMLRAYSKVHDGDELIYEVLGVEVEFKAPLLNPATWRPSRSWLLAGKVDVIVRRRTDGRVLIIEHKTTSDDIGTDAADYWTRLVMDPQISEYVVGAESLGHKVDEILYDVLKKPAQRPLLATPKADRKYLKGTTTLYANQRDRDETPEEHRARVRAAIFENAELFLQRKPIPRTQSQVEEFLTDAWQQSAVMRDCTRLGRSAKNPDACLRMGRCAFWDVCSTGGKPEDYPGEYVRITNKNPELTP